MASTMIFSASVAVAVGALARWPVLDRLLLARLRFPLRRRLERTIDELETWPKLRSKPLDYAIEVGLRMLRLCRRVVEPDGLSAFDPAQRARPQDADATGHPLIADRAGERCAAAVAAAP